MQPCGSRRGKERLEFFDPVFCPCLGTTAFILAERFKIAHRFFHRTCSQQASDMLLNGTEIDGLEWTFHGHIIAVTNLRERGAME